MNLDNSFDKVSDQNSVLGKYVGIHQILNKKYNRMSLFVKMTGKNNLPDGLQRKWNWNNKYGQVTSNRVYDPER